MKGLCLKGSEQLEFSSAESREFLVSQRGTEGNLVWRELLMKQINTKNLGGLFYFFFVMITSLFFVCVMITSRTFYGIFLRRGKKK